MPSTLNNIRYAGGRVEFFADGTAEGAVYLCGERHYMPMYGRFLQRDRLTYEKLPSPTNPLSANPYIYAENNPVMKKDIYGLQPAGYFRGATMGGKSVIIGTQMPPEAQIYDCCGGGYHSLDATEVSFSLIHSTRLPGSGQAGYIDFTRLSKNAGWGGSLCDANPEEGQPNPRCPETTTATSDLLCTYVERCMGGSCPDWHGQDCPSGMAPVDVGGDGDPGYTRFPILFTDIAGEQVILPPEHAIEFQAFVRQYRSWWNGFSSDPSNQTGLIGAIGLGGNEGMRIIEYLGGIPWESTQGLWDMTGINYFDCGTIADEGARNFQNFSYMHGNPVWTTPPWLSITPIGFPAWPGIHNWNYIHIEGEDWGIIADPWIWGEELFIVPASYPTAMKVFDPNTYLQWLLQ